MNSEEVSNDSITDLYNTAAVMAKAKYVLKDVDFADSLQEKAVEVFTKAEEINTDDETTDINRVWAASEIYRITGIKTYRTVVEAYDDLVNATGFSFDNPGYYAVFSYLTVSETTDYALSSSLMSNLFAKINGEIKKTEQDILDECLKMENFDGQSIHTDYITQLTEELKLSVVINRISMSVEYVRYAKDRIIFLAGANPAGINYLDSENIMNCETVMSALLGVRSN